MSFIQSFILDPIRYRSLSLAKFRICQLLHVKTRGAFDIFYRRLNYWFASPVKLPPSALMSQEGLAKSVLELKSKGYVILPFRLSERQIQAVRNFAFTVPAYPTEMDQRVLLDADRVPNEHPRYYWPMRELVTCPAVKEILSDSALYMIAQEYLGPCPVLAHVTLWLDPVYDGYYDAHIYHYDNDGPGFLKFFLYLTDVTEETGAHRFIQKSHSRKKPPSLRLSKRYRDADLLNYYGVENEIVVSGSAGTILAEDTAGFHRGTTLASGYRLLMQFQFSLVDIPHAEEIKGRMAPVHLPALDPGIASIARKFFHK